MSNPAEWCFVSGLVSARSERLMDERAVLGVLDAATPEDLRTRLRASLLFADTPPSDTPADEVNDRFAEIVAEMAASSPDPRIADLFLQERDWLAFRRYAKDTLADKGEKRAREATPDAERHKALWNGNVEDPRHQPMADAAVALREAASETDEDLPSMVDRILDAHETAALCATAETIGGEALPGWGRLLARLRAGLTVFRAGRLGWDTGRALAPWQAVGFDAPDLLDLARAKPEDAHVVWDRLGLPEAGQALQSDDAPVQLERAIEARVSQAADEAQGVPFGPEVVFAFLWALRGEALNLRIVLTARACGMDEARVAAQLRK